MVDPNRTDLSSAHAVLTEQLFVISNGKEIEIAGFAGNSGQIITGANAVETVRKIRRAIPDRPLLAEPISLEKHNATLTEPFMLPGEGLFRTTLNDVLDEQRNAGATIAVTPTGFIQAGDEDVLREVIEQANGLERTDIAVGLALHTEFLREQNLPTLIAIAKRSVHPLLVGFGAQDNPLKTEWALRGHDRFFTEVRAFNHRTDMAGFHAISRGALGASIGVIPSYRRFTPPEFKGQSRNPKDRTPHVFFTDLLRFVQGSVLHRTYFASAPAPDCWCEPCDGKPLDRFINGGTPEKQECGFHNAASIGTIHDRIDWSDPAAWWKSERAAAAAAANELGGRIGRPVDQPADLRFWAKLDEL
jgi:hypothetical protein